MARGRPKGIPKTGGGSRKGVPNKLSASLKEMILQALDKAGGVQYLTTQARDNPSTFLSLVGRVLPLQVGGSTDLPPVQVQRIERVIVDKATDRDS